MAPPIKLSAPGFAPTPLPPPTQAENPRSALPPLATPAPETSQRIPPALASPSPLQIRSQTQETKPYLPAPIAPQQRNPVCLRLPLPPPPPPIPKKLPRLRCSPIQPFALPSLPPPPLSLPPPTTPT